MVPWCVDALHGRFHWREPGSGLRLSQPATPAPALTLGVRHLSCGVSHPCSGRLTGSAGPHSRPLGATLRMANGLRFACIPFGHPSGPRNRPRGVSLVLRGFTLRVGGVSLVLRGRSVALCVPVLPARLNAYALTIPIAGRCPRSPTSPNNRPAGP